MKINLTTKKVNLKDSTKEKLEKKLAKFDKILKDDATADVKFKMENDLIYLEIAISSGDMILRAQSFDEDAKTAIDKIISLLEGQLRKYKTKLQKKVKNSGYEEYFAETPDSDYEEETEFNIVKTKKFSVKPMSVDEAILQMNLLGHEFYVFTNAEDDKINIVYKRKDKNYGLIETN